MRLKKPDWPHTINPVQQLLIKACLTDSKEERQRYVKAWDEQIVIKDLDFSSSRLMPYFFYRNQQDSITSRHDERIKIIYKYWWLRTKHISHQLKKVLAAFAENKIETVVIKGASIKTYYELGELRPMADFDLLVSPADLQPAVRIIQNMNYAPRRLMPHFKNDRHMFFDFVHAFSFAHKKNDTEIDLHWKIGSLCSALFTERLWSHLEEFSTLPNVKKPQLSYEVFMIIIHAIASGNKDNLNWIIDIAVINKKADRSFWREARKLAVAEKKEDMFDYGCSILTQLGVSAPDPGKVRKPRQITPITREQLRQIPFIRGVCIRMRNVFIRLNRMFPHDGRIARVLYLARWVQYYFIKKSIRIK